MLKDNWLLANVIASIVVWMIMIWLFGAITLFITYTCLIVIIGTYGVITDHINPDIKKNALVVKLSGGSFFVFSYHLNTSYLF